MVNESMASELSPKAAGYRMPAEWAKHRTCYTAWPSHDYAWGSQLGAAQREFAAFVRAFVHNPAQESLSILVDAAHLEQARSALPALPNQVRFVDVPCGDIWLRDTGPLFLLGGKEGASVRFRWNGWGNKFLYPHDAEVSTRLAALRGGREFVSDFVLEGGAIEVDGQGTCLTTRSCVLNPNRLPSDERTAEARLGDALGVTKIIWLDAGLANDHTDGHIDNIARFVPRGAVVCMQAHDEDDPNRQTLDAIAQQLSEATDARGQPLRIVRIPSPGLVLGADGQVAPASYMNFYIGNARVLMPAFGTPWDEPARLALQALFADREVVASSARAILEGGGTFHCMTQQEPLP
jgi:agmatine deiminase